MNKVMPLTESETEGFKDGILMHCNEPVAWLMCDEHSTENSDCIAAMCIECHELWCDTNEFGEIL